MAKEILGEEKEPVNGQSAAAKKRRRKQTLTHIPSESQMMLEIEQRVGELHPKDKKGKRKKTVQVIFLVLLSILSLFLLMQIGELTEGEKLSPGEIFGNARFGYFWIAVCLLGVMLLLDALKFSYIMKLSVGRFRPILGFKVAVLGRYYDNLTPFSSGGQPFQIYYLSKRDMPIGVATSIPLIKYFIQMFVWIFFALFLFVVNNQALSSIAGGKSVAISIAAYFGLAINAVIPVTLIVLSFLPKFGGKAAVFFLKIGVKLKLVKDYESQLQKAYKMVDEFKSSMKYISTKVFHIFVIAIICLTELVAMLSIPYFLCLSLGNLTPSSEMWFNIMTLYSYSLYSVSFLPVPGTSGFAEGSFFFALSGIPMAAGVLFWVVLLWRLLTYYSFILMGFLTVASDFIQNRYKEKFIERKRLLTVRETLVSKLNSDDLIERMANLRVIKSLELEDKHLIPKPRPNDIKMRLKSCYSGNFQTPTLLAYKCYAAGCKVAGLSDSDTLSGAKEFYDACSILGVIPVIGTDIAVRPPKPLRKGSKINYPFQADILNMSIMGIPPYAYETVEKTLILIRDKRNARLKKMVEALNLALQEIDVSVSFEKDVLPLSKHSEGGSITELHLASALAKNLVRRYGKGPTLLSFLTDDLGITLSLRIEKKLLNVISPEYMQDLTTSLTGKVREYYLPAAEECLTLHELQELSKECGGVIVYPYLGDIEQMVFGEIRVEKYEDSYLEELIYELSKAKLSAVSYSPQKNTEQQQLRIKQLCLEYELLELCDGTIYTKHLDVKEPELDTVKYKRLIDCVYAVVGSSIAAEVSDTMFSESTEARLHILDDKIALYGARGRTLLEL